MSTRNRLIITAAAVCHALLAPTLLFSQLQPAESSVSATQTAAVDAESLPEQPNYTGKLHPGEPITIKADTQEEQNNVYRLHGNVEISFRSYTLKADEMTYNDLTGEITATGHVVFDGGPNNEHLTATSGAYNRLTESGHFYDVVGTTGAKMRGRNVVLTSSTPFSFVGRQVDIEGGRRFVVHHGTVTSCAMPRPKWWFRAEQVSVVAGEDAKIYNSSFWFWRMPLFYFPFLDHPVERMGRKSGFLLPTIGRSSRKGNIIGDSYFWAINRSMDATVGAEYYSKRGWAQHGEYRARLTEDSSIMAEYFGVLDRGLPTTQTMFDPATQRFVTVPANTNQGGQELKVNASGFLLPGLRGVADIDYLSSYIFRAAFSENFTQAINSEVRSTMFLTKNWHGYSFNGMSSRYQNFSTNTVVSTTAPETVETIVHAPSFEASSMDRKLGRSPLYWGFNAAGEGLSRREPSFVTADVVGRYDIYPRITMPLRWREWNLLPEVALRDTWYGSRLASGLPVGQSVNRRSLQVVLS
jgi:LPS-assembly protein